MYEFKTVRVSATAEGQRQKGRILEGLSTFGWEVVSESVESGKFRGSDACCLGVICLPLAFLAGREAGNITVTLRRDLNHVDPELRAQEEEFEREVRKKGRSGGWRSIGLFMGGILIFQVILGMLSGSSADKADTVLPRAQISVDAANLRDTPAQTGSVIVTLQRGHRLTVAGQEKNGWIPVTYGDRTLYIHTSVANVTD